MQIDSVMQEIDEELTRLRKAREIIAALLDPLAIAAPMRHSAKPPKRSRRKPAPESQPAPTVTVLPPRKARERRPRKRPEPERGALASTIPSATVVVAPSAVTVAPPAPAPRPESPVPGSFGALVQAAERELSS